MKERIDITAVAAQARRDAGLADQRRAPRMNIFVAGATGVIGRRLLPRLVAAGHRVAAAALHVPPGPAAAPMTGESRVNAVPTAMSVRRFVGVCALVTALATAGCAGFGDNAPAVRPVSPDELHATTTLATATLSEDDWPQSEWWTMFQDAQLDALEGEALAGSPSLALAEARVARARALAGMVRSKLRPNVDANAAATRQRFSDNDTAPPPLAGNWRTRGRMTLDFDYDLDPWGGNHAALAAALSEVEATRVDAFAARLLLSTAVAASYVELAHLYDRLDIERATLRQRRGIYDLTRRRVRAGLDSRVELKQAEAALPATRENIAALSEQLAATRSRIAALLGRGPDRGLTIERPVLHDDSDRPALPSRLPADLLGRRPDVVASRWRVEAAGRRIEVAKAGFYPNVNLLAFAGFQSIGLSDLIDIGSGVAGIGPAIHLPVLEGGRLRGALARSDAEYDAAVARYNRTLADALRDIADRLASIRSVAVQKREQRIALAAAREAHALALQRFRAGVGTYLTVLSTETAMLAQRRLGADLRARTSSNRINLVLALGGGFDPAETGARTNSSSKHS
ncbi:MAG: efflux transporter outer membrane subunit [Arenicellales bacterium]